ncbi:hypothetical protein HOY80DRAFT_1109436 [Tuber brumale]|nr:hypothetical protein HOY80DRAFT_1109436 [Tuber brumale]
MNENTSRDVDFPSQQDEQEGNLFAKDDATDIDEDSDEAPQRHRRSKEAEISFSSQSQQAQIHSGNRRVNSPHFTPSILGSQPILTHQNGCQTAEEDNNRSNFMRGEERIVFENAANMVQYHTWFVNPFVKPSENDSLLESYWVKAASKLGWPGLAMQKHAMTFLKSRQSSARSHLVSETRITMQDFYDLLHKQPAEIRVKVSYLLEDDCFTCHPRKQEAWSTGTFVQPSDFSALTEQSWFDPFTGRNWTLATWQRLPVVVQKKLVEDTKKRIKCLLRDNGFVQEPESRAALEDPDAAEYLRVQVSGDEESEVEDNNWDPEVEDVIDALVEGPEEDE